MLMLAASQVVNHFKRRNVIINVILYMKALKNLQLWWLRGN